MLNRKAQSVAEYATLMIVVMGALLGMGNYIKRGFQGRWKAAVDDLGEQYDPAYMNTRIVESISSTTHTDITTNPAGPRHVWTMRTDTVDGTETRFGQMTVGGHVDYQPPSGTQGGGEEDDGNRGHGNDDDGHDDDNPGQGGG